MPPLPAAMIEEGGNDDDNDGDDNTRALSARSAF